MLTEICGYLKNWFVKEMLYGDFIITNGVITYADGGALPLQIGQHFRIVGSVFNDGVFEYGEGEVKNSSNPSLVDEIFNGSVWTMAVPLEVIEISQAVDEWKTKYEGVDSPMMSPYNSESFGGYSYSKSAGNTADKGNGTSWQSVFGSRLARFRKV